MDDTVILYVFKDTKRHVCRCVGLTWQDCFRLLVRSYVLDIRLVVSRNSGEYWVDDGCRIRKSVPRK